MKAYLVIKMYSQIDINYAYEAGQLRVKTFHHYVSNWNMINAANKYEADGKALELAQQWIETAKDSLPEYNGTGKVDTTVWELTNDTMSSIVSIIKNTI
jgi:hypothetical protein